MSVVSNTRISLAKLTSPNITNITWKGQIKHIFSTVISQGKMSESTYRRYFVTSSLRKKSDDAKCSKCYAHLMTHRYIMVNHCHHFLSVSSIIRMTVASPCSWSQKNVSASWTPNSRRTPCWTWSGGIQPARRFSPWWRPSVTHSWSSIGSWCQKSGTKKTGWETLKITAHCSEIRPVGLKQ